MIDYKKLMIEACEVVGVIPEDRTLILSKASLLEAVFARLVEDARNRQSVNSSKQQINRDDIERAANR